MSLVHCSGSNAEVPEDGTDASVTDGGTGGIEPDGGDDYKPCGACGENQVCSNGQCADLPSQCPCPKGSYCDLGANRCIRGCIEETHCSTGEYCETGKRTCNAGCNADKQCKSGEFCRLDTHTCTVGCRTNNECTKPATCQVQGGNRVCTVPWRKAASVQGRVESVAADTECIYALISEETARPLDYAISEYCSSQWNWRLRPGTPTGRSVPHIGSTASRLFIAGGVIETDAGTPEVTTRVTYLNRSSSSTVSAPPMNVARRSHGMVSDGRFLYAVDHGSIEACLAPDGSRWGTTEFPKGTLDVAYPGVAAAGEQILYATGGLNAQNAPTAGIWKITSASSNAKATAVGTLKKPRGRHGLVAMPDGTLYVFGGDASRRSVEVFPGGREIGPMPNAGNVVGAALKDGYFYVMTDSGEMITNAP